MTAVSREVTTSAHAHDLGRTALAAHLMGVDHDSYLVLQYGFVIYPAGSSSVVAAAGCCLVASAPVGPVQQSARGHGRCREDGGEQVADLGDGQRDRVAAAGGVEWIDGPLWCRVGGKGGQERQRERDVPVPGGPVADLVVVESDLALAWKHSSTLQRIPATRTSSARGTSAGDQHR